MNVTPFLTLTKGQADAAARFYASVFPNSAVTGTTDVEPSGAEVAAPTETSTRTVSFTVAGVPFIAMDMDEKHVVPASWANSYMVTLDEVAQYDTAFAALAKEGTVMMEQGDFGKYRKVCWITDKFGITWQLVV